MKMHLASISVREFYGRTYDLVLQDLSPGLTVIFGRNASGKTVLTRAASTIFSATDKKQIARTDRILGRLVVGQTPHEIDLHGPKDSVPWPQSSRAGLYRLMVTDLIVGPAADDLQRITKAFAGGVDLKAISPEAAGRKPSPALQTAWNTLQNRQRESAGLRSQEEGLKSSRIALAAAKQAREDAALLVGWLSAAASERAAGELHLTVHDKEQEHPGIEQQSEDAPTLAQESYKAYLRYREQLRAALKHLEVFGGRRSRLPLQRADSEALSRLQVRHSQFTGGLNQAKAALAAAELNVRKAEEELRQCADRAAPVPLSAEKRQILANIVRELEAAKQVLQTSAGNAQGVGQAMGAAQSAFRNAGGDPDDHPAATANLDSVHQLVQADVEITAALAAVDRTCVARGEAERVLNLAREAIPAIRVPARDVLSQLLQDPKIASLQDQLRGVREQRKALEVVADHWDKEVKAGSTTAVEDQHASETLRDWLRMIPESRPPESLLLQAIVAIALAVCGLIAGAIGGWGVGAWVGIVGLVLLAAWLFIRGRTRKSDLDRCPEIASRVPERCGPAKGTVESVADRYTRAVRDVAKHDAAEMVARDARNRANSVDDSGPAQKLLERRDLFTGKTGVKLDDGYELANTVHRLLQLADAELGFKSAKENEAAAKDSYKVLVSTRDDLLAVVGAPVKTGAAAKVWRDALAQLLEAEAAFQRAEDQRKASAGLVTTLNEQLREFLGGFGWPADGDPVTARDGFEKWFTCTVAINAAQRAVDEARKEVEDLDRDIQVNATALVDIFNRYDFPCQGDPADSIKPFSEWFEASERVASALGDLKISRSGLMRLLRSNGVPERIAGAGTRFTIEQRCDMPERRAADCAQRRVLVRDAQTLLDQAKAFRGSHDWSQIFARLELDAKPEEQAVRDRKSSLDEVAKGVEDLQSKIVTAETLIRQAETANDLDTIEQAMADAVSRMDAWLTSKLDEVASRAAVERIVDAVRQEATPAIVESANRHLKNLTGGRYGDIDVEGNELTVVDGAEESRRKSIQQLSTGTRIHLALAARLAIIEVSETDSCQFPLLLDEIMATSDPEASKAIAEAMKTISQERQVLLFTNQPDDVSILRLIVGQELSVKTLGQIDPPSVEPSNSPPEDYPGGLPITTPIALWPPILMKGILPDLSSSMRTVHDAATLLDDSAKDRVMAVLEAMEVVRLALVPAYRRLRVEDLTNASWITTTFRERVRQELEACGGNPRQFLSRFRQLGKMRDDNKQACEEWLQEQGHLAVPPSRQQVLDLAQNRIPMDWPDRLAVSAAVAGFFRLYTQAGSAAGAG